MKQIPPFFEKQLIQWGFTATAVENLCRYAALVEQWQKAINLVSPNTIPQLWERHLMDSAQLWPLIKSIGQDKTDCVDLGSGGGFPGLVMAIAGAQHVTMIESDKRKCIFLREVARELGLTNVTVHDERIEAVESFPASFVTARALTALKQLYEWALPFAGEQTHMLFLKGQDVQNEISTLPMTTQQNILLYDSFTDHRAKIVAIDVSRETIAQ